MKIFIGYDSRESIAFEVAKYSVIEKCEIPVEPLNQEKLRKIGLYWREEDTLASTEFSLTRFLVPELMNFNGWALFVDCDVLFLEDPSILLNFIDEKYALLCVKHNYKPSSNIKMDGKIQHLYPRKNWSSVMLFNCGHPSNKVLTKDLVNSETPSFLHQMKWLNDEEIGELPLSWNWLVEWYKEPLDGKPSLLHYTEGGPWFENFLKCEYSEQWIEAEKRYRGWTL